MTVDRFVSELVEVAVVEAYEKRFGRTISGKVCPTDVVDPEPDEEDEDLT